MQKIIRVYPPGYLISRETTERLQKELDDGYVVVRCDSISNEAGVKFNDYIIEKVETKT